MHQLSLSAIKNKKISIFMFVKLYTIVYCIKLYRMVFLLFRPKK